MDHEKEINDLKEANLRMLTAITCFGSLITTLRTALEKLSSQVGIASLDGVPIHQWIDKETEKEVTRSLVAIQDGQLSAELQRQIDEVKKIKVKPFDPEPIHPEE